MTVSGADRHPVDPDVPAALKRLAALQQEFPREAR